MTEEDKFNESLVDKLLADDPVNFKDEEYEPNSDAILKTYEILEPDTQRDLMSLLKKRMSDLVLKDKQREALKDTIKLKKLRME